MLIEKLCKFRNKCKVKKAAKIAKDIMEKYKLSPVKITKCPEIEVWTLTIHAKREGV